MDESNHSRIAHLNADLDVVTEMFERYFPDWLKATNDTRFQGMVMAQMGYQVVIEDQEHVLIFWLIKDEGRRDYAIIRKTKATPK